MKEERERREKLQRWAAAPEDTQLAVKAFYTGQAAYEAVDLLRENAALLIGIADLVEDVAATL